MTAASIGVGILGLGFMGRQHLLAYRAAEETGHANHLVAVCDGDPARRRGTSPGAGNIELGAQAERLFDPDHVRTYARPIELLADPDVDLISICTYTDTHVDLALAALEAGKHVLVEKPVALRASDARRLADGAAARPEQVCMPAMCMRYWPGWDTLARTVHDRSLGPVRRANFIRRAPVPNWGTEFYDDVQRCGGPLFDVHVHDADFVRWAFGLPDRVISEGDESRVVTSYVYEDGPDEVVAEGAWLRDPEAAFHMGFRVEFEGGVLDYAFGRDPVLQREADGRTESIGTDATTGYDGEIMAVLAAVLRQPQVAGHPDPAVMIADAVPLTAMLEAERASQQSGEPVDL